MLNIVLKISLARILSISSGEEIGFSPCNEKPNFVVEGRELLLQSLDSLGS